jgi:hypothetical protein
VTILAAAVLLALGYVEDYIADWRSAVYLRIRLQAGLEAGEELKRRIEAAGVRCRSWTITKDEEGFKIHTSLAGPQDRLDKLQGELVVHEQVASLKSS